MELLELPFLRNSSTRPNTQWEPKLPTSFLRPTPPSSSASEELISSSALDQPSLSSGASKG